MPKPALKEPRPPGDLASGHVSESSEDSKRRLEGVPFLRALLERRSRRFGMGMEIPGGPLSYKSRHKPASLSESEEAALVFAASGITGSASSRA